MRYAGTKLAQVRESQGMTQKHLAEIMGLAPTSVSAVENMHVYPWPKFRTNAAIALNCSEEELFEDMPLHGGGREQ